MKTMTNNTGELRRLIVMIILTAFFNGSISAQKSHNISELEASTLNLSWNNTNEILKAYYNVYASETFLFEESMIFEDWMSHPSYWTEKLIEREMNEMLIESEMNFESWMFETDWSLEDNFIEEKMQFELWMMAPALWGKK